MKHGNDTAPAYPEGNYVFPTPWSYDVRTDGEGSMRAWITDFAGFEFASFDGDEEDGERFLRSARAMEHANELLEACETLVDMAASVAGNWENGNLAAAVQNLSRHADAATALIAKAKGGAA